MRIADVLIAAALLAFTLPLMMFAGLAIKLESSGPVLCRRSERGRYGRQFTAVSFRTTAERASGSMWGHSAHQTPIAAFIQYTGIVDLPRLVNALRGDTSLVETFPNMRKAAKWAAWVLVALVSGALFKGAQVLALLAL